MTSTYTSEAGIRIYLWADDVVIFVFIRSAGTLARVIELSKDFFKLSYRVEKVHQVGSIAACLIARQKIKTKGRKLEKQKKPDQVEVSQKIARSSLTLTVLTMCCIFQFTNAPKGTKRIERVSNNLWIQGKMALVLFAKRL